MERRPQSSRFHDDQLLAQIAEQQGELAPPEMAMMNRPMMGGGSRNPMAEMMAMTQNNAMADSGASPVDPESEFLSNDLDTEPRSDDLLELDAMVDALPEEDAPARNQEQLAAFDWEDELTEEDMAAPEEGSSEGFRVGVSEEEFSGSPSDVMSGYADEVEDEENSMGMVASEHMDEFAPEDMGQIAMPEGFPNDSGEVADSGDIFEGETVDVPAGVFSSEPGVIWEIDGHAFFFATSGPDAGKAIPVPSGAEAAGRVGETAITGHEGVEDQSLSTPGEPISVPQGFPFDDPESAAPTNSVHPDPDGRAARLKMLGISKGRQPRY